MLQRNSWSKSKKIHSLAIATTYIFHKIIVLCVV